MKIVRLPIQIIPIDEDGFHMIVKGEINGLQATLLIDTGASRTVFDRSWIEKVMPASGVTDNEKLSVGLGTNSMPSIVTVIDLISFGHLKIKNYQAVALDLSHVLESYSKLGLPRVDGILGGDLLYQYRAVVDYGKSILTLNPHKRRARKS